MTHTRWYVCGANQRRDGKPCKPAPACKDWERRHWIQGYTEKGRAISEAAFERSGVHCTAHVDYDVDSRVSGA